ncbi:phosphoglycerate mutase-like protein [Penicillium cosmopolitanum]|uniref:Phosphoglycerate mutase-like protein n=1 Tax=Penicillium cosmopolitanum TaxID=1131564 RepID=A0A9W9SKM4_9EURO|nr:phosphoglycerate mutase-like protein [Penicillium cosmopolitanum]KAJ5379469.1 phosphoglycerate mutase-like protein [Penicillium cosmopolitanum]
MAPKLHLIRHAQGYHNLGPEYWNLIDPLLTDEGKKQCSELSHKFPTKATIDLIVTSPMRRAIYTGIEAFGSILEGNPKKNIIALPILQEVSDLPCDTGSELKDLLVEIEQKDLPVDLGFVEENWSGKSGKYEPTSERIRDRAREARCWLKERPESEIVVVSHGGFLHFLTDDWEDGNKFEGTGWANTELRTYEFVPQKEDPENNDNASIQETMESRQRRGKYDSRPTPDYQKGLYTVMLQAWEEQGCPIG